MLRSALTLAAAGAVALSALSSAAFATPKNGFVIYKQDGDTVKKIYDDGRLDGRGCIVGKVAVFDPSRATSRSLPE